MEEAWTNLNNLFTFYIIKKIDIDKIMQEFMPTVAALQPYCEKKDTQELTQICNALAGEVAIVNKMVDEVCSQHVTILTKEMIEAYQSKGAK